VRGLTNYTAGVILVNFKAQNIHFQRKNER